MGNQPLSSYLQLYKFLPVLNEEQITKLRKIALGILDFSAFTNEEISSLETKLMERTYAMERS
jgi:hypothetical protein